MTKPSVIHYPKSTTTIEEIKRIYISDIQSGADPIRCGTKLYPRNKVISGIGYSVCKNLGVLEEYKTLKGI